MSSFLLAAPGLGEPKLLDQVRQLVRLRHVISFIESLPWTRLSRRTAVLPQLTTREWPLPSSPLLSLARKGIRGRDSVHLVNRQLSTFVRPVLCSSGLHSQCRRLSRRLAPLHTNRGIFPGRS